MSRRTFVLGFVLLLAVAAPRAYAGPPEGRAAGDFDGTGCADVEDFLYMLDHWQQTVDGVRVGLPDHLGLLNHWLAGPACPTPTPGPSPTETPGDSSGTLSILLEDEVRFDSSSSCNVSYTPGPTPYPAITPPAGPLETVLLTDAYPITVEVANAEQFTTALEGAVQGTRIVVTVPEINDLPAFTLNKTGVLIESAPGLRATLEGGWYGDPHFPSRDTFFTLQGGEIRLRGLVIKGLPGSSGYPARDGWPAFRLGASSTIQLVNCSVIGGDGGGGYNPHPEDFCRDTDRYTEGANGASAIYAAGKVIADPDTTFTGGSGGPSGGRTSVVCRYTGTCVTAAPDGYPAMPLSIAEQNLTWAKVIGLPGDPYSVGDFDASGCTNIADFLILLDHWWTPFEGVTYTLINFLNLLDNWQQGPSCA